MIRSLAVFFLTGWLSSAFSAHAQTLEETWQFALLNHPSLESARIEVELSEEGVVSSRAQRSVQISASLSSAIQSIDTNRAFAIDIGETFLNQAQIEAVLPLYTSGALDASVEQAKLLVEASREAYKASKQALLLNASIAHLDVLEALEAVRIRSENVKRLEQQFRAASDRFDIGVITRTDVALSDARLQVAMAGLAAAEAGRDEAVARYFELTGTEPSALAQPSDITSIPQNVEDAFGVARTDNPKLKQLRLLERVAEEGEKAARSQRKLKIEAFGNAAVQDGRWENDFRDTSATIGVRASKPLYSGGALLSAERQALKRTQQARLQTKLAENQLLKDLSSSWYRETAAQIGLEAAKKEVDAASVALEGAEVEVSVGLRTTLDLLDQEQDLLDAQLRLIGAKKNLYITRLQILALIGKLGVSQ